MDDGDGRANYACVRGSYIQELMSGLQESKVSSAHMVGSWKYIPCYITVTYLQMIALGGFSLDLLSPALSPARTHRKRQVPASKRLWGGEICTHLNDGNNMLPSIVC